MAEITTLEERVPLNATVSQPNFTAAMTNLASSPSVVAQIGSQVASAATTKLVQEKGLELGNNPQGNLPILPINDYMKTLQSTYNAQSQAVLGLRAQEVINQANEEMAKNPALSSGDIQAYKETLSATLKDISGLAPTGVKQSLENSFSATLQNNTHQYVLKMNAQQRKEAAEKQFAYADSEQRSMQEAFLSGDPYQAEDAYANALASYQSMKDSRDLSQPEYDAKVRQLDILYQQSQMMRDAFAAEKKKGNEGIEKFLKDMPDKKPDGMSYADYSVAMNGVAAAVSQRERLMASNRSMIMSEAVTSSMVSGQPPSSQQIISMKDELTTQQFNETMLRINSALTQRKSRESAEDSLYANRASTEAWYEAGGKAQKATFNRMTNEAMQASQERGNPLSEIAAMTNVAKSIPIPTNAYTDRLSQRISSGSPEQMAEAAVAYEAMTGGDYQDSAKVSRLDDKAKVAAAFMNVTAQSGLTVAERAAMARNAAYNRTTEQNKAIDESYARFERDALSTKAKRDKFVSKLTGNPPLAQIHEANALTDDVIAVHKKFYELAGSNTEVANKLTQDYVDLHYGYSYINGVKEYVLNPAERIAGLETPQSIPLIHEDAVDSISKQVAYNNELYQKGASQIKYELEMPKAKDGTPLTYENYYKLLHASIDSKEKNGGREATDKFIEFRNQYYDPKSVNVKVTRRFGSKEETEDMSLVIYPTRAMQQDENHSTIGGFDVGLRAKNGLMTRFTGWTSGTTNRVHYTADAKSINERAGSIPMNDYVPEHLRKQNFGLLQYRQSVLKSRGY